jgi:hypothetical protein
MMIKVDIVVNCLVLVAVPKYSVYSVILLTVRLRWRLAGLKDDLLQVNIPQESK